MKRQFSRASLFWLPLLAQSALGQQPGSQPPFEDMNVHRIQVVITTGHGQEDGTDDRVYVKMNDGDERFFLNRHIDDFKKGSTVKYDVLTSKINKVRDIQGLRVGLAGDDKVCISRIELILNNQPVFSGPGRCVDNNGSFPIDRKTLRDSPRWRYNGANDTMWKSPNHISRATIVSLVEGSIGNQLAQEKRFLWEGKVDVKRVNDSTLQFHVPLERDVFGPNFRVDMSMDLKLSCDNGHVKTSIADLKFKPRGVMGDIQNWVRGHSGEIIGAAVGALGGGAGGASTVAATIEQIGVPDQLRISPKMNVRNPNLLANCRTIRVTPGADIELA